MHQAWMAFHQSSFNPRKGPNMAMQHSHHGLHPWLLEYIAALRRLLGQLVPGCCCCCCRSGALRSMWWCRLLQEALTGVALH